MDTIISNNNSTSKSDVPAERITRSKKPEMSNEMVVTKCQNSNPTEGVEPIIRKNDIALIDFSIDDIVWAKIKGSKHWPARIVEIELQKRTYIYKVFWFNDYRTSNVFKSQIFKFQPNFEKFAKKFGSDIRLETAGKEALIYLASKEKSSKQK